MYYVLLKMFVCVCMCFCIIKLCDIHMYHSSHSNVVDEGITLLNLNRVVNIVLNKMYCPCLCVFCVLVVMLM